MTIGQNKEPWDIVPNISESFGHLAKLAERAVKDLLGPSPQEAEIARSREEYDEQVDLWHRLWREDPASAPPFPKRPESLPMRASDMDAWLIRRIQDRLLSKLDTVLLDLVGLEHGWHGSSLRMKSGTSPFSQRLVELAKAHAATLADRWVAENHAHLLDKHNAEAARIDDVFRLYRIELERATKMAIEERVRKIANERAQAIRHEVLEAAIDKAMYDAYPILRRAEAARRLGAKGEADAA